MKPDFSAQTDEQLAESFRTISRIRQPVLDELLRRGYSLRTKDTNQVMQTRREDELRITKIVTETKEL